MKLTCWWCVRELERRAGNGDALRPASWCEQHARSCRECRAAWAELQAIASDLRVAVAAPAPSEHFEEAVWTRIAAADPVRERRNGIPIWAVAAPAVAVLAAAVTLHSWGQRTPAAHRETPMASVQPDPALPHTRPSIPNAAPGPKPVRPRTATGQVIAPHSGRVMVLRPASVYHSVAPHRKVETRLASGPAADPPLNDVPDERWLDGRDTSLFRSWNPAEEQERRALEQFLAHKPPVKDDFVRIPLPRLAGGDLGPALAAAEKEYAEQAKVVDTRLFRKVTLRLKAASLAEFCAEMKTQTGVDLRTARGLDDEKVTVLVKEQRARDVMREVSRLFGYYWGRTGTPDNFHYDLEQDLRSQLAEEELRNRDANAALLAMDTEMQKYRPYLSLTFDQLEARFQNSDGEEHKLLFTLLVGGGWGPAQLYTRLSPAERAALAAGQEVVYSADAADPARRLPPEWRDALTRSTGYDLSTHEANDEPPQVTQVRLKVDRSELGQVSLSRHFAIRYPKSRASSSTERAIATGQSPSVLKPDNATLNAALKEQPLFKRVVTVKPQVSCPRFREPLPPDAISDRRWTPHVTSADVWEAVHDATGMNIVADAYTRLYPQGRAVVQDQPLFDVLCREGDLLGSRWKQDGEFLLCRSTSYFWDKLKEVPTRLLRHWSADRQANGGVPLADFLEIAGLTDQQLGSRQVADAAAHCWDLPEWDVIGGRSLDEQFPRTDARFITLLTPKQLEQAQTRDGLLPAELTPRQQRAFLEVVATSQRAMERQNGEEPHFPPVSAITLEYVPAGWYRWRPPGGIDRVVSPDQPPYFSGRDPKQVLAAVRRFFPNAKQEEVERQPIGQFSCGLRFGPFPVGK